MPEPIVDLQALSSDGDDVDVDELNSDSEDEAKPSASQLNSSATVPGGATSSGAKTAKSASRTAAAKAAATAAGSASPTKSQPVRASAIAGSSRMAAMADAEAGLVAGVKAKSSPARRSKKRDTGPRELNTDEISELTKGALKRPRNVLWSVKSLHDMLKLELGDRKAVDLNPTYQRDVVWPEKKQEGLIQSMFLNYFIMPVLFAVEHTPGGDEIRVCIDGKQRCTSIEKFMDGKIPYRPIGTKDRYYFSNPPRGGLLLPAKLKHRFEQMQIPLVEYEDLSDMQQRDIFQRVQLGVALTAAEKLQAIPGPWTEFVSELFKKYLDKNNPHSLASKLKSYDNKRAKPFQQVLSVVMMAYAGDKLHATSAKMTEFLQRQDEPEAHFRRQVDLAMSIFLNLANNHYDEAFGGIAERVAPIEFAFIGYLITQRMGIRSIKRLAADIHSMRKQIRTLYERDVRDRSDVVISLYKIIGKLPRTKIAGETTAEEEQILNGWRMTTLDNRANEYTRAVNDDSDYDSDSEEEESEEEVEEEEEEEDVPVGTINRANKRRREYDEDPNYISGGVPRHDYGSSVVDNLRSRPERGGDAHPLTPPQSRSPPSSVIGRSSASQPRTAAAVASSVSSNGQAPSARRAPHQGTDPRGPRSRAPSAATDLAAAAAVPTPASLPVRPTAAPAANAPVPAMIAPIARRGAPLPPQSEAFTQPARQAGPAVPTQGGISPATSNKSPAYQPRQQGQVTPPYPGANVSPNAYSNAITTVDSRPAARTVTSRYSPQPRNRPQPIGMDAPPPAPYLPPPPPIQAPVYPNQQYANPQQIIRQQQLNQHFASGHRWGR